MHQKHIRKVLRPLLVISILLRQCASLNNGMALTPPMGWMSWLRFGCSYRCDLDPDNCISEKLFKEIADAMVDGGFVEAGYDYLSIDDCWSAHERDAEGRLYADPVRFPSGIKGLADYVHSKGMKLGLYLNIGTKTCAGYPGTHGYVEIDAQTMADWGVDKIKFDGCYADLDDYTRDFPLMKTALNKTGRPILYSCQWPMYAKHKGGVVNYTKVADTCNMFRALTDIYYNYHSVESMILYWANNPYNFTSVAGAGAWNDPDQLTIGNSGLSEEQEKAQMAMWCMMASPLIFSNDPRNIRASSKKILLNRNVISINQDPLGIQGRRYLQSGAVSVWYKPIMPENSLAIAFMNIAKEGATTKIKYTIDTIDSVQLDWKYDVYEAFDMKYWGRFTASQVISMQLGPTSVVLLKAIKV